MTRRQQVKAIGTLVVAALALVVMVTTGPGISAAQSAQGKAKHYKGTRAIIVDADTGQLRLPTQQEVDQAVKGISSLVPRPVEEAQAANRIERRHRRQPRWWRRRAGAPEW